MKLTDLAEAPRPETRCWHVPVFSCSRSHTHHNELSKVIHPHSLAISLMAVHIQVKHYSFACELCFDAPLHAALRSHPCSLAISLTAVHIQVKHHSSVCELCFNAPFCAALRLRSWRTLSLSR